MGLVKSLGIKVKRTQQQRTPGYYLVWPIRGCAAGPSMVFELSVLNVQGTSGVQLIKPEYILFCESVLIINRVKFVCTPSIRNGNDYNVNLLYCNSWQLPSNKQDREHFPLVLNRICILLFFCLRGGHGFKPSAPHIYPNIGRVTRGERTHKDKFNKTCMFRQCRRYPFLDI